MPELGMQRLRIGLISLILPAILLWTAVSAYAAPLAAIALQEGRTYDQAHDTGYIDWSGPAQYVYVTHRDGSSLPPEEGGTHCNPSCSEWVTRLGNGGAASGLLDRDVSYFEIMVEATPDSNVGSAILQACSATATWTLHSGTGLPGFVSMPLTVPAGCRSWSLTASGGYVDFRSIDVYYVGLPSTATPTAPQTPSMTPSVTRTPTSTFTPTLTNTPTLTFTPTFTATNTATATFTFTPTVTYTNTPSSTPTPLPPQITGAVICDRWGEAGWCRGNETLELAASDPQGLEVTIAGDLNGEPFTCGNTCDLLLSEGMGTASYTVISTSGRTASGTSTWQRDATPPDLDMVLPPVDGRNGWYVSEVDLSVMGTDAISGLSALSASTDGGMSWATLPIHFAHGSHAVLIRVRDVAGNEMTVSKVIRVDTMPPVAQITSHINEAVVQGDVRLAGSLVDDMSGSEGGEVSIDGGNTWQSFSMGEGEGWFYIWHSSEIPNGEYTIQLRSRDHAGNVGDVISVRLTVDNAPPAVSITERWWNWESGSLKVSANHFPIAHIQVTIRDPQNRWPAASLNFDPGKNSYIVKWDRRFGDGTIAPIGEYPVLAEACNVNGLCGQDAGRIVIPEVATPTATLTISPTTTNTLIQSATLSATRILPSATPVSITPGPEMTPELSHSSFPFWQTIGLLGLFMVIATASVIDHRPEALARWNELVKVLATLAKDESIENK